MTASRADHPEVSVVIPTHNRATLVREAALSALGQEEVSLEVIVVDDCSSDGTGQELGSIDDPRLRHVRLERQSGPAAARNRGIAEAKGEWLAFLDDDDRWAPQKLRRQLDVAAENGAGWAWCGARAVDENGSQLSVDRGPGPDEMREKLRRENAVPAGASNVIAKADVMREVGGFDEALPHLSDWDIWMRLADSVPGAACAELLVEFVIHPGAMHSMATKEARSEFETFRARYPDVDARRHLDWIAKAHWDAGRRWPAVRDWLVGRWRYRSRRGG